MNYTLHRQLVQVRVQYGQHGVFAGGGRHGRGLAAKKLYSDGRNIKR